MKTQGSHWLNFAPALIVSAMLVACGGTDYDGTPIHGCNDGTCVDPGPVITSQPTNSTIAFGASATFSVSATGSPPLSYQWYRNGTAIDGAVSSSYTTPPVTLSDDGAKFSVQVSDAKGKTTSTIVTLKMTPATSGPKAYDVVYMAYHGGDVGVAGESALNLFVDSDMTAISPGSVLAVGSTTLALNAGAFPVEGDALPLSGTLAVTYANARTSQDASFSSFDGSASVKYDFKTASNPTNFGGQPYSGSMSLTTNQLHIVNKDLDPTFDADFTANGTGSADFASTLSGGKFASDVTYRPGAGSSLAEAANGLTATYASGAIATHTDAAMQSGVLVMQTEVLTYTSLNFAINGSNYVADGSMTIQFGATTISGSGEILIKQGSTTVGRIFADGSGPHFDAGGTISPVH